MIIVGLLLKQENQGIIGKASILKESITQYARFCRKGDIIVEKISSNDNLEDPFTKALKTKLFDSHVYNIGLICTL